MCIECVAYFDHMTKIAKDNKAKNKEDNVMNNYTKSQVQQVIDEPDVYTITNGYIVTHNLSNDLAFLGIDEEVFYSMLDLSTYDKAKHGAIVPCLEGEGDNIANEIAFKLSGKYL